MTRERRPAKYRKLIREVKTYFHLPLEMREYLPERFTDLDLPVPMTTMCQMTRKSLFESRLVDLRQFVKDLGNAGLNQVAHEVDVHHGLRLRTEWKRKKSDSVSQIQFLVERFAWKIACYPGRWDQAIITIYDPVAWQASTAPRVLRLERTDVFLELRESTAA